MEKEVKKKFKNFGKRKKERKIVNLSKAQLLELLTSNLKMH
jgi:hypothetical protein